MISDIKLNNHINLEKLVKFKEEEIAINIKELQKLKSLLANLKESKIPILIFSVNEAFKLDEETIFNTYEHVYYCPDIDEVKCIYNKTRNTILPYTVDLRWAFKELGMPERLENEGAINYPEAFNKAIELLKEMIDDLMENAVINSWKDLANLLSEIKSYYFVSKREELEKEISQRK